MGLDLALLTVIVVRLFLVTTMLGIGARIGGDGSSPLPGTGRWLAAMLMVNLVVLPALGTFVCLAFGLRGEVAIGILACAVAPAGSLAPKLVQLAGGELRRGVLATVVLSALATVTVPASITVGAAVLGLDVATAGLDIGAVFLALATFLLVPMLIGIAIARVRPTIGAGLVRPLTLVSSALIAVIVVVAVADTADDLALVGLGPLVAMSVVALGGHAIGWRIGGDDVLVRRTSALVSAQRSPGLALLVVAGPGHPVATAALVVATVALTVINLGAAFAYGRSGGARPATARPLDALA